jgi:hypothetical protein
VSSLLNDRSEELTVITIRVIIAMVMEAVNCPEDYTVIHPKREPSSLID